MDNKEIKATLKNAREAIRNKEFKDALKHCKVVLSADKNNYMALVLIAVAAEGLEEYDQALKAYKRAIEADDSQALAWQGLSSFYEKNALPAYKTDHIKVYLRLLDLYSGDKEKKLDVLTKLVAMLDEKCEEDIIQMTMKHYRTTISEEADGELKKTLQWRLVSILKISSMPCKDDEIITCCRDILTGANSEAAYLEDIINTYLNLFMKRGDQLFIPTCKDLYQTYPDSVAALQYHILCQLDDIMVNGKQELNDNFEELITKLDSHSVETEDIQSILRTAQGYICLCRNELQEAKNLLNFQQRKKPMCAFYFLALTFIRLHDNIAVLETCDDGLKALEKKDRILSQSASEVTLCFNSVKIQALYQQGTNKSLNSALELLEKEFTEVTPAMLVLKGHILVKLGNIQEVKKCVTGASAESVSLKGKICLAEKDFETAKTKFQEAIEKDGTNYKYHLDLAVCLWESGDRNQECFHALLKAAKLDPYCSLTFMYLGHYYSSVASDTTRACKCYQKSFDLDDLNEEAGAALCDLQTASGEEEEAYRMLVDVTSKASAGSAKWAWLRLGLYQVKHDDPSVAIASFQAALRADPTDNHVWECLAEAYYQRGSYTAALKAFSKGSELDPDSMYCLFQMASIKQTLGVYSEAIEEYKVILEKSPNYVPALKGLGETYLLQARSLMSKCIHARAKDNAQCAILHLTRAVSHRPDLSCMWKLMGDACTMLKVLPLDTFRFEVPAKLVKSSETAPDEMVALSKIETLQLGGRCYGKALKIYPECSSLWHDLGINYFHQSQSVVGGRSSSFAEKSVQALKKAISLESANHKHWTALGHVTCHKDFYRPDLAQHCFIKSIQCEPNNVVAWTNLAALYLKNANVQLAHEAFKVAQSLEPSYIPSWIGQAIIAETVGHDDAMDLFRHTTELGNHIEGAMGYAHWVCSLLLDTERQTSEVYQYAIHQMAAIPAASDALARYTDRVHTNWIAYNMYGLLLEQQKLYRTAAQAFEKALKYVDESARNNVQLNYARVLCKSGQYEKAVSIYSLLPSVELFHDLCQLGLAAYKAGNLEQSFQAYTEALSIASTEAEKSHVYSALAMVQYKFGDIETTKSTLFKGFQLSEPSLWGLEALCALGLLQSDVTLATAVQEELFKHGGADSHNAEVVFLDTVLNIQKEDAQYAVRQLEKLLQKDTLQADVWHILSAVLLRYFPHRGMAITNSARSSLVLDKKVTVDRMKMLTAGQLCGGYHSNINRDHNSLSSAQKLVRCYPDNIENWALLASAVHAEAILRTSDKHRLGLLETELHLLQYILSQDTVSLPLKLWCHKQCVVCAVHAGKQNIAFDSLEKLLTDFGGSKDVPVYFEVFKNVLMSDINGLKTAVQNQSVLYYWQILADLYIQAGVIQDVKEIMELTVQSAQDYSENQVQVTCLLKLAHFIFHQLMKQDNPPVSLREIFEEAISQVKLLQSDCFLVDLMLACLNFQENKSYKTRIALAHLHQRLLGTYRLSKHHSQNVLHGHITGGRGHDLSLARQMLVFILHKGKKDEDLLETILAEAEETGDQTTVDYYQRLTPEQ